MGVLQMHVLMYNVSDGINACRRMLTIHAVMD